MREFIARGVDGIIVFAGRLSDAKLKELRQGSVDRGHGPPSAGAGAVQPQIDDRHGAMLAVRHLNRDWHRKIAFIAGSENHPDAVERFRGYKKTLEDAGIDFRSQSWWRSATGTRKAACAPDARSARFESQIQRPFLRERPNGLMAPASRSTAKDSPCPAMCR